MKVWEDLKFCKDCLGLDVLFGLIDCIKFNVKGFLFVVGYLFVVMGGCIIVIVVKLIN